MSTDPREYVNAEREQIFREHEVIARFGELTLTRLGGRLWLFLSLSPIMTQHDTEAGRARLTAAVGVLVRDLMDAAIEVEAM